MAISVLFFGLLICGLVALLPMFGWHIRRLIKSSLFIKSVMWVPMYLVFVALLYGGAVVGLMVAIWVDLHAGLELLRRRRLKHKINLTYAAIFTALSAQVVSVWLLPDQEAINLLITVCFASVLSDVTAFFFGKYLGKHYLPKALNQKKSWEGVFGQFAGALLGVSLLYAINVESYFWLWVPIAFGTAAGDLFNSYVKRLNDIKDWSQSIPGHGGYADRFISLFGGLTIGVIFFAAFST